MASSDSQDVKDQRRKRVGVTSSRRHRSSSVRPGVVRRRLRRRRTTSGRRSTLPADTESDCKQDERMLHERLSEIRDGSGRKDSDWTASGCQAPARISMASVVDQGFRCWHQLRSCSRTAGKHFGTSSIYFVGKRAAIACLKQHRLNYKLQWKEGCISGISWQALWCYSSRIYSTVVGNSKSCKHSTALRVKTVRPKNTKRRHALSALTISCSSC